MAEVKADAVSMDVVEVLRNVRKGAFLFDLTARLEELVKAIREHGKGGEIKIRLAFAPLSAGSGKTLTVTDTISVKAPEPPSEKTVFFSTSKGTLQRENPEQMQLGV